MYIDKIPDDAKQINNSRDFVDPRGNVYGIEYRNNNHKGEPFTKSQQTVYGYKYVRINYNNGRHISKRVHRLVAEAFIPNPENLPIVMHKNNNKKDNNVENLKWGTVSENTQQAFEDGLVFNASGYDDSQSFPCDCYDTLSNELVGKFGSVSEASKSTGISKSGILYQLKNPEKPISKKLYFVPSGEGPKNHNIVVECDINSDSIINKYTTSGKASKSTGIAENTIREQIKKGKPNWSKSNTYFKKISI